MWELLKRVGASVCLFTMIGFLAACGATEPATPGDTDLETAPPVETMPVEVTEVAPGGATDANAGATELDTSAVDANLAFTESELSAPANSEVTLTFNNESTLQHNWVLVDGGMDVAEAVNTEALQAAPDFIPDNNPQIIAATELLDPNTTGSAAFTTPAAGEYIYLCTFPGHFQGGMYGTLIVE